MKHCDCIKEVEQKLKEQISSTGKGHIAEIELTSGRTYSTYKYRKEVGKRLFDRSAIVVHSHCPFRGEKYEVTEVSR